MKKRKYAPQQKYPYMGMTGGEFIGVATALIVGGINVITKYVSYYEQHPIIIEKSVVIPEVAQDKPLAGYYQSDKYVFIRQADFIAEKLGDLAGSDTIRLVKGTDKPINNITNYYNAGLTKDNRKAFLIESFSRNFNGAPVLSLSERFIEKGLKEGNYPYFNPNQDSDDYIQSFAMAFVTPSKSPKAGFRNLQRTQYLFADDKPWEHLAEKANYNGHIRTLMRKFRNRSIMGMQQSEIFKTSDQAVKRSPQ
ncbi:MAG TPA: hypothetical protein VGF14_06385 [Alphaproteobacteria bacterium]